ncbi:MAG: threonylcarbamoyl-AMP synthase [Bacteroidales bacterium]|nr:threonylcarbamoyl-AMP synthase [Bacteroidales bacterium]MDE6831229.1 threonylcarbamoyl-AMP synthase [Muribaculaceae bacterium]
MNTLIIYPTSINERFVGEIVDALRDGHLIICPTDSRYAICCDALNNRAIERVCHLKDIDPRRHPLSILCSGISQASQYARIDNVNFQLIRSLTPGPFTFILPGSPRLPKIFKGRKEVGVRIPDNTIARAIADALGNPLMTTSLPEDFTREPEIHTKIDGGDTPEGDSTIVDCLDSSEPTVIRQGLGDFKY